MGLFAFTAKGANPATLVMEYFYPSKESLPSPDVITDSKAHVEFNKAQREIGNEIISSTLWASVYEVVPPDLGAMSVFYVYYLDVQNPKQYLQEWKSLMNTLKKSDNIKYIIIGLLVSVIIFYFKDLSLALGQTNRIPLVLSVWAPVIALSLFTSIGVIQINEK